MLVYVATALTNAREDAENIKIMRKIIIIARKSKDHRHRCEVPLVISRDAVLAGF